MTFLYRCWEEKSCCKSVWSCCEILRSSSFISWACQFLRS